MINGNLVGLESIPKGIDFGNNNEEMVGNVFPNSFDNRDSPDVIATPLRSNSNMIASPQDNMVASNNVS